MSRKPESYIAEEISYLILCIFSTIQYIRVRKIFTLFRFFIGTTCFYVLFDILS